MAAGRTPAPARAGQAGAAEPWQSGRGERHPPWAALPAGATGRRDRGRGPDPAARRRPLRRVGDVDRRPAMGGGPEWLAGGAGAQGLALPRRAGAGRSAQPLRGRRAAGRQASALAGGATAGHAAVRAVPFLVPAGALAPVRRGGAAAALRRWGVEPTAAAPGGARCQGGRTGASGERPAPPSAAAASLSCCSSSPGSSGWCSPGDGERRRAAGSSERSRKEIGAGLLAASYPVALDGEVRRPRAMLGQDRASAVTP
jgi:hypothetical protein